MAIDTGCECQACEEKRTERRWNALQAFVGERLEQYDVYWTTDAMKYRAFREMQDEMRRLTECHNKSRKLTTSVSA
jgi:hypothetical protein